MHVLPTEHPPSKMILYVGSLLNFSFCIFDLLKILLFKKVVFFLPSKIHEKRSIILFKDIFRLSFH